jgi:hypothetical protein
MAIAVFGGAVVDLVATPDKKLIMGSSNPGNIPLSPFVLSKL